MPAWLRLGLTAALVLAAHARADDSTQRALAKLEQTVAAVDDQIRALSAREKELETELIRLRSDEAGLRGTLQRDLKAFYVNITTVARLNRTPAEPLRVLDALSLQRRRQGVLKSVHTGLSQELRSSRRALDDLERLLADAESRWADLTRVKSQLLADRRVMAALQSRQLDLMTLPAADRERLLARTDTLGLSGLVKNLLKRPKATPTPRNAYKNLPLNGDVILTFNDEDPETGLHAQGLTIRGDALQEVRAVAEGRVIYSGSFKGYRYLVILEHRDGMHSLYGGMGQSDRAVGDDVRAGALLGRLPNDDKPTLYLEVRRRGEPMNPAQWLAQLSRP